MRPFGVVFLLACGFVHAVACTSVAPPPCTGRAARAEEETTAPARDVAAPCSTPRLIVQITVDQLRGDLLDRYAARFGPDGFSRFVREGVRYLSAHYRHAVTETAPGHATLVTGVDPAVHGIVANDWYERESGVLVYNTLDIESPLRGVEMPPDAGRSPQRLLAPTLADQLFVRTAGAGKAFAVSVKDRAAILPAGRSGKPFWYDKRTGRFISSAFYYPDALPAWVKEFNRGAPASAYGGQVWELSRPRESYLFAEADARSFEGGAGGLQATFPHP